MIEAVALYAAAGGIWRRILGGWFGLRRSFVMACGALLAWPFWFVLPWWGAILATGAMLLFFAMGHRFDKWTIILRYPLVGVIYPIARFFWASRYTEISEVVIGAAFWGAVATVLFI